MLLLVALIILVIAIVISFTIKVETIFLWFFILSLFDAWEWSPIPRLVLFNFFVINLKYITFLILLINLTRWPKSKNTPQYFNKFFVVFIFLNFISILVSSNKSISAKEAVQLLYYIVIVYLIFYIFNTKQAIHKIMNKIFTALTIMGAYVIVKRYFFSEAPGAYKIYINDFSMSGISMVRETVHLYIEDIRALRIGGVIFVNSLLSYWMVAFVLFLEEKGRGKRRYFLNFVIIGAYILLSFSRGAWLGIMVAISLYTILSKKKMKVVLMYALVGVLLMPLHSLLLSRITHQMISGGGLTGSAASHAAATELMIQTIRQHPLSGIGIGTFRYLTTEIYLADIDTYVEANMVGHNVILEMAAETGIIATCIFLFMLYRLVRLSLHTLTKTEDANWKMMIIGLLSGTIAVIVHNLTISNLTEAFWIPFAFTVAAINIAERENSTMRVQYK